MYVLVILDVHGHGRGTCLGTCLVCTACVMAFVACVDGDTFFVMYLILLKPVVHRHGRGPRLSTCLVYATCVVILIACITNDELCCPKSLYANKQHICTP